MPFRPIFIFSVRVVGTALLLLKRFIANIGICKETNYTINKRTRKNAAVYFTRVRVTVKPNLVITSAFVDLLSSF